MSRLRRRIAERLKEERSNGHVNGVDKAVAATI